VILRDGVSVMRVFKIGFYAWGYIVFHCAGGIDKAGKQGKGDQSEQEICQQRPS
jgi:hypothetical protein